MGHRRHCAHCSEVVERDLRSTWSQYQYAIERGHDVTFALEEWQRAYTDAIYKYNYDPADAYQIAQGRRR